MSARQDSPYDGISWPGTGAAPFGKDYAEPDGGVNKQGPESNSWLRQISAAEALDGTDELPTIGGIGDGKALFYRGRVNGIIGESESGKSWLAVHAVIEAIKAGEHAWWFDFDSTPKEVFGRLRDTGVSREQLTRFHYCRVDDRLDELTRQSVVTLTTGAAVIVLDGMQDHYGLEGLRNDWGNTEVTAVLRRWQEVATATSAAVICIDHVTKASLDRGGKGAGGSHAKRDKITGSNIKVQANSNQPIGRGRTGWSNLSVDKDRGGHLRGWCADGRTLGGMGVESHPDSGAVLIRFRLADQVTEQFRAEDKFMRLQADIKKLLRDAAEPMSREDIRATLGRQRDVVIAALAALRESGEIQQIQNRTSIRYKVTVPTVPDGVPDTQDTVPTVPAAISGDSRTVERDSCRDSGSSVPGPRRPADPSVACNGCGLPATVKAALDDGLCFDCLQARR